MFIIINLCTNDIVNLCKRKNEIFITLSLKKARSCYCTYKNNMGLLWLNDLKAIGQD